MTDSGRPAATDSDTVELRINRPQVIDITVSANLADPEVEIAHPESDPQAGTGAERREGVLGAGEDRYVVAPDGHRATTFDRLSDTPEASFRLPEVVRGETEDVFAKKADATRYSNALAAECRALGTQDFGDAASALARDACAPKSGPTGQPLS